MRQRGVILLILLGLVHFSFGQKYVTKGMIDNPAFDQELQSLLKFSVPILSVKQANEISNPVYLDARESAEYIVSHIPGALKIGFTNLDLSMLKKLDPDQTLIVYCSVGYRSEIIADRLLAMGHKKVYNLYGSIFEWANQNLPLVDNNNTKTNMLHTYNKSWAKWLNNPKVTKVW